MQQFVKRRGQPATGSIAAALDIFRNEVRFYREIAPDAGIRVPASYAAHKGDDGTVLMLEDLSSWQPGADPAAAAAVLSELHHRWSGRALARWPWLRPVGAAAGLIADLYRQTWPALDARADMPPRLHALAARLVGKVSASEEAIIDAGELTLVHGDASTANMRTSADGEIALLDWEDVSAAPGMVDLAWLLVSSVEPERWGEVVEAYGMSAGLGIVMPAVAVQGLLSMSDHPDGSAQAAGWIARLTCANDYLQQTA